MRKSQLLVRRGTCRDASVRAVSLIATESHKLALLASYGLPGEETAHAARGPRSAAHLLATLDVEGGFGMALDPEERFVRLPRAFATGLRDQRS